MTSNIETFCSAELTDLTTNVTGLSSSAGVPISTHILAPWSPEEMVVDNARHLAVWPQADNADTVNLDQSPTGSHLHAQFYMVAVWEKSEEGERGLSDTTANSTFFDLYEAVRARMYVTANQQLGASALVWFEDASFPEESGTKRWFRIRVRRHVPVPFT